MHCFDEYSKLFLFPRIQFRFDQEWGKEYGSPGGKELEVLLDNEHIVGFIGTFSTLISQINIITDQPRDIILGSLRGRNDYSSFPKKPTYVFKGVCGFYGPAGIKGIKFLWGTVNSTCS